MVPRKIINTVTSHPEAPDKCVITVFTLNIGIPYFNSLKLCTTPLDNLSMFLNSWISDKQCRPWSDAAFDASDQDLHCLLRPVCPYTWSNYSTWNGPRLVKRGHHRVCAKCTDSDYPMHEQSYPGICSQLIQSVMSNDSVSGHEGSDQNARMCRLIWAFGVRICPKTRFPLETICMNY